MNYILKRVDGRKVALITGILMSAVSLIFYPIMLVSMFAQGMSNGINGFPPTFIFLFMPVIYFVLTYLITRLSCAIFNFAMKKMNGIRIELELEEETPFL